ncbi:MAG: hypothetical protein WAV72_10090, partial [Bradyrhizobium sp.]
GRRDVAMTFASFHESNPVRLQGFPRQMNPRTIEQASWNRWSRISGRSFAANADSGVFGLMS